MAGQPLTQQDLLSNLLAAREIHAGNDVAQARIAIERLEVHLGQPAGVGLTLGRVHALSSVRRRRPLYLLPPRPPRMVDRAAELQTLSQTLYEFHTADLHGPDGLGKSALAAALVHALNLDHFPDGVVYVSSQIPYQDLLQALFEGFYESDRPIKITAQHAPTYLHNLRALVILDDVGLGPQQVDPILDALGNAAVLIVGAERTAVGRGHALALKGLPRPEAVTLFAGELGRALTSDEHPVVEQICATLNDAPLPISCVAAHAAQGKQPLTKLLTDLQERKPWAGPGGDPAVGPSLERLVLALDATDRQLLTLVAAFAGPSASGEALRTLLNLPADLFKRHVERLQGLGLLHAVGPDQRLALPPAYCRAVRAWLVDDGARRAIVNYYVTKLGHGDRLPGNELPGLLGAIHDCASDGWLDALKPLVLAADRSLGWLGWWAEWQGVLDLTRRAAQAEGDRPLEAWATHQLGSSLGALGHFERALHLLRTALGMREAMDDKVGAALSAGNLEVLSRLLPAPAELQAPESLAPAPPAEATHQPLPAPLPRAGRRVRLKVALALLAALIVLVTSVAGWRLVLRGDAGQNAVNALEPAVSWEFGDAWNSSDNESWTQQVIIVVEGSDGDYRYFVDGEPSGQMFEVTLPLCDGARGVIQVESRSGQTAQVEYEFDSPFCR